MGRGFWDAGSKNCTDEADIFSVQALALLTRFIVSIIMADLHITSGVSCLITGYKWREPIRCLTRLLFFGEFSDIVCRI